MSYEPVITRNEDGTVSIEFPDPPRRTYEVAHEVLVEVVEAINLAARLRLLLIDAEARA